MTDSSFILHPSSFRATRRARRAARGFSLTEVMFAVIVLGIGFILVAAIFPVAISQSRLTVDETTGAAAARSALALTQQTAIGGDSGPTAPLVPSTEMYLARTTRDGLPPADSPPGFVIPPNSQVTVPGKVMTFNDERLNNGAVHGVDYRLNLWNAFRGSMILPADPRYAWVPVYRRDTTFINSQGGPAAVTYPYTPVAGGSVSVIQSPYAQVYFIPVAVRNRSTYEVGAAGNDLDGQLNLIPRRIQIRIRYEPAITDYVIEFAGAAVGSVVEGCYVIVSDDKIQNPAVDTGLMNGRVYRVGNRRVDLGPEVWEFAPGSEFARDPGRNGRFYHPTLNPTDDDDVIELGNTGVPAAVPAEYAPSPPPSCATTAAGYADALVIGRNPIPGTSPIEYEGPAQDVGVYVTFIRVN